MNMYHSFVVNCCFYYHFMFFVVNVVGPEFFIFFHVFSFPFPFPCLFCCCLKNVKIKTKQTNKDSTRATATVVLCGISTDLSPTSCCTTALYDATTTVFEHSTTVLNNTSGTDYYGSSATRYNGWYAFTDRVS